MSKDSKPLEGAVDPLRQRIMRSVRRIDTHPEMTVRKALFERGYRYRLHVKDLPGTPDIVFRKRKIAVFVHGCFWHRHLGCRLATTPKTRVEFWNEKFRRNLQRDAAIKQNLQMADWTVVEIWECDVKCGAFLTPLVEALGPPKA
jgi:DNA mismatch endonuclease (patch repair protein)